MAQADNSSIIHNPGTAAAGWRIERLIGPSPLHGSNGMRFGPDGLLYVAQCFANEITAFDIHTGARKEINRNGDPIKAPDDLAFDSRGVMYVTEFFNARVTARMPGGKVEVLIDHVPGANGITVHQDRIFMDECRPADAQVVELFRDGRPPKVLADGLDLANALSVGPDGKLYFPQLARGEVCRVPLEGGPIERVAQGLAVPTAVKFDNRGNLLVLQALSGEISRIDVQSLQKSRVAMLFAGLDNLVITPDDRLFVSNFLDGTITEIAPGGQLSTFSPAGFTWLSTVACAQDGTVYLSDFGSILRVQGPGRWERIGWSFDADFPGSLRAICAGPGDLLYVTTMLGQVSAYDVRKRATEVLATNLESPFGIARAPGGAVFAVERGGGRVISVEGKSQPKVIARGLDHPMGVAAGADGSCYVSETGKGRVVRINGGVSPILEGLEQPQGLAVSGSELFVLDTGSKQLWSVSLNDRSSQVVASDLPVGAPVGVTPQPLPGISGFFPGPILSFAGITVAADGTVYVAADREGSLLAVKRQG